MTAQHPCYMDDMPEFFRLQMMAMETLNLNMAWQLMQEGGNAPPIRPSDEVLLISLHKARVELVMVELPLRLESVEWLRARGYTRRGGIPLPPPGETPY